MKIEQRIKGMDVSTLLEEERCGAMFYDNGIQYELFDILERYKVNSVRLRLWNNPYSADGRAYGAGTNDLETTLELARRATAHNMSILLDFHYSDFWADPGKQYPPKAWADYSAEELTEAVYKYTKEVILRFTAEGIKLYMVQIGNEMTNGCCWPLGRRDYGAPAREESDLHGQENGCSAMPKTPYFNPILGRIIASGIRAVREASPETLIMLHLDNGGSNALYRDWFDGYFGLDNTEDFDVIGLSYYPFWHGNFAALERNMHDIAVRYGKELVVAEVSMGHSMEDYRSYEIPGLRTWKMNDETVQKGPSLCNENVQKGPSPNELKGMATREELVENLDYPMTPEGQKGFMEHLNRIIAGIPKELGRGYYYWEPAWIPVPGCGWATPASLEYIHDKGPCGNEWANQALFDYEGNALPALKI